MDMKKVVIFVSGGVVTGVMSNDPSIKVELKDFDDLQTTKSDPELKELVKQVEAECPHELSIE